MRAGNCLHLILEKLDFTDLRNCSPLVTRKLADFHFENFDDVVCEMLKKPCASRSAKTASGFLKLRAHPRLSELEFTFPITTLTTSRLRKVFQIDELPLAIDRLQFDQPMDSREGFIDLVFEQAAPFLFC